MDIHSPFACVSQLTVNTTNAILYSCMATKVPNAGKRPLLSMMYNGCVRLASLGDWVDPGVWRVFSQDERKVPEY